MKRWLFPPLAIKIMLIPVSVLLLIYSLGFADTNSVVAYVSYLISAYTLTIVLMDIPRIVKWVKKKLYTNQYSGRYLSEPILRATISLYAGTAINVLYALFYLGTGIYYLSLWTIAIAVYYIVLSMMRYGLIRKDRKRIYIADEIEQRKYELSSSHFCGCLMFVLNIAVSGLVVQMIWQNKHYDYPGFLIYAQAAYAFYCLTRAIINVMKYRKMERPILSAAKVVSMSCALTSILTLQTAMLTQFGEGEEGFTRIMNSLTGGAVCFVVFCMAVWMVHVTRKELRLLKD